MLRKFYSIAFLAAAAFIALACGDMTEEHNPEKAKQQTPGTTKEKSKKTDISRS